MIPFELAEPKTLADAIKLLDPDDPTVRPFGGCTAMMLMMKAGVFHPTKLVSLRKIEPKYSSIAVEGKGLRIGAMATLGALERSDEVKTHLPLVDRTLLTLANVRVRNVATVGGALAHGDPHMDLPPVLMSLGAVVTITGPKGDRTVPLEEMLTGYYETSLEKDELISSVYVPSQGGNRGAYMKVTTGSADDWPAVGIATVLETAGDTVKSASVVVSAATTKATRIVGAEAQLAGKKVDDKILDAAAEAALQECDILSDVRGSAPYKRELVRVYLKRAVRSALDGKMGVH
jgi:carbon-monoxide dehydrogenase medium subunit